MDKNCFLGRLPSLKELKDINVGKGVPAETAWIWGKNDEVGRLNLLTAERVRLAKDEEVKEGIVTSLNWNIKLPAQPAYNRPPCKHRVESVGLNTYIYDDFLDMNIQSGSQWDGFRHYGHIGQQKLYNNLDPSEIHTGTRCGMQAVSDHGIVGRGVLLDYYSWSTKNGKEYDPFTSHAITVKDLKAVAEAQDTTIEVGDILLIRSGYTARYYQLEKDNPQRLAEAGVAVPSFAGVEQSETMKEWLHDSYFAAVGGDAPAFEVWPGEPTWKLHEYLLALWGMLIGEMFDLEALSKRCEERQRWSFFFVSAPMNIPGGIASLANAVAIH